MVPAGDPASAAMAVLRQRMKAFTLLHASGVVVSLAVVGWFLFAWGLSEFFVGFLLLVIVMPAGVVVLRWMNQRSLARTGNFIEKLRPRLRDASFSGFAGFLLLFDNGLVLGIDSQSSIARFRLPISAGESVMRPTAREAARWSMQVRGIRSVDMVSPKRGDPQGQAEVERLRVKFGARWGRLLLQDRSSRILADPSSPQWEAIMSFFAPRLNAHGSEILSEVDAIAKFLEEYRKRAAVASASAS